MDEGVLRIHQWRAEYRLPRQDPNLAQRLDHVLHKTLPEALKSSMASLGKDSEEIWLIRCLAFDLDVDLGLSDWELARYWANRFVHVLARTLAQTNSKEVVYFPDRRAYLARFLVDLAGGAAWSAWYFRKFAGLKALPVSMALRTAVLEDPALGQEALLRLDRADRARVLSALTDGEARRIVTCLAQQVGSQTVLGQADVEPIRVALADRDGLNLTFGAAVLYLYLRVAAARPQAAGRPLAQICVAVIELRNILETLEQPKAVISAVAGERMAVLHRLVSHASAERLQMLFGLPVPLRNQLLGVLSQAAAAAQESLALGEEPRFSLFGGAFLLLPLLMAMPLEEALAPWPQPEETDKRAAVRLMLLAQCLGGERTLSVFRDSLLRELAGVAPGFTVATARQWLNSISVAQQHHCFRVLAAWWLARLGESTVRVIQISHDRHCRAIAYAPRR